MAEEKQQDETPGVIEFEEVFYSDCSQDDKVILADVTHDSIDDMLTVSMDENMNYECRVYFRPKGDSIISSVLGSGNNSYAGGFYMIVETETLELTCLVLETDPAVVFSEQ